MEKGDIDKVRVTKEKGTDYTNFITWLRALGVIFILLCHYTQQNRNQYVVMSSQFFNIGNDIFFIISGYCFGIQNEIPSLPKWYKKRIKRIYIPYEIMLFVLAIVSFITSTQMDISQWIAQILGLQGWNGVTGAVHTWFITSILLCYMITPILEKLRDSRKKVIMILAVLPIIITYFASSIFTERNLIIPICWYAIAYLCAEKIRDINAKGSLTVGSLSIMMGAFLIRLLARRYIDGTVLYDVLVAGYTHAIGAFCIVILVRCLFLWGGATKHGCPKIISMLSKLSYEIYLWHYMFTSGPVSLFGCTPFWILDCILVTVVSLTLAYINYIVAEWVTSKIFVM